MESAKKWDLFEFDDWLKEYNFPDTLLKKIMKFRSKQANKLNSEQLDRVPIPKYIPSGKELIIAIATLLHGANGEKWEAPLLIGPRGSGKSTLAETLAAILLIPVTKIFGGIDIDAEALFGSKTIALKMIIIIIQMINFNRNMKWQKICISLLSRGFCCELLNQVKCS